jgi:hypothetical protein
VYAVGSGVFSQPVTQNWSPWPQASVHCIVIWQDIDCEQAWAESQQLVSMHGAQYTLVGMSRGTATPQVAASELIASLLLGALESGGMLVWPTPPPPVTGGEHVTSAEGVQFPSSGGRFGSCDEHAANHATKPIPIALMNRLVSL